jgi:hypothetical protein
MSISGKRSFEVRFVAAFFFCNLLIALSLEATQSERELLGEMNVNHAIDVSLSNDVDLISNIDNHHDLEDNWVDIPLDSEQVQNEYLSLTEGITVEIGQRYVFLNCVEIIILILHFLGNTLMIVYAMIVY